MNNVILGAGGFAREVAAVMVALSDTVMGYASDDPDQWGKQYEFAKCLGPIEEIKATYITYFTPGIGSPAIRRKLVDRALALQWKPRSLVSPRAPMPNITAREILRSTNGTIICAGVAATVNITLGNYVNVNLNCTLGHDCVIEDYVNLSPAVNVSGYVHIEEGADIGTGAVLLPHVRIGKGATIGAGAVVNKDVPAGEVWVGIPAKKIK